MHIMHVITALPVGGAQTVLRQLVTREIPGCRMSVVSLMDLDVVGAELQAAGIEVRTLGMRAGGLDVGALWRLRRLIHQTRPDRVQTWLYHADLLGGLAARLAGVREVYWNLRNSDLHPATSKRSTRTIVRLLAALSGWLPRRIVCCAVVARDIHVALGYDPARFVLIDNGVDLDRFRPDPAAGEVVRRALSVAADRRLVGHVARFHPQKDHAGLLAAAVHVLAGDPAVEFVLAGDGVDWANPAFAALWPAGAPRERVHALGRRGDVPALLAACQLAVSSSAAGEAFPNMVVEAMACGVPCVVTDCGDSTRIVGETGWVVPVRDSAALAASIQAALRDPAGLARRGRAARARAEAEFGLDRMLARYAALYGVEARSST
jgi:glycosyltransferase involved in cell wall biosynthesis